MTRMKRGLRSEAIREYLTANPNANPKRIVAALEEMGIEVTVGLASNIKYGGKRRKAGSPAVRAVTRRTWNGSLTVEQLLEVKRLSDSLGGVDRLRLAVEALDQFR